MTQKEARQLIWSRLAETARNDACLGDWITEAAGDNERDIERIEQACSDVAAIIERVHLRGQRTGVGR